MRTHRHTYRGGVAAIGLREMNWGGEYWGSAHLQVSMSITTQVAKTAFWTQKSFYGVYLNCLRDEAQVRFLSWSGCCRGPSAVSAVAQHAVSDEVGFLHLRFGLGFLLAGLHHSSPLS